MKLALNCASVFTSIRLRNVRCWKDQTIDLRPLTVFVGANASGKTTILNAIHYMRHFGDATLFDLFRTRRRDELSPAQFLRDGESSIEIELQGQASDGLFIITLKASRTPEQDFAFQINWDLPTGRYKYRIGRDGYEIDPLPWSKDQPSHPSLLEVWSTTFLHLDARVLASASYSSAIAPEMEFDGSGLASKLAYMKQEHNLEFVEIQEALRKIVPAVREIRLPREKVFREEVRSISVDGNVTSIKDSREYVGNRVAFDMSQAQGVPASLAGEGTLLTLGVLSALAGPTRPRHVLVDDIDMRLHPKAQGEFVAMVRSVMSSSTRPLQFIGTTHSPFFIQHLSANEAIAVAVNANESIALSLADHPDYEKWKNTMGVGEFWSFAGETWLKR